MAAFRLLPFRLPRRLPPPLLLLCGLTAWASPLGAQTVPGPVAGPPAAEEPAPEDSQLARAREIGEHLVGTAWESLQGQRIVLGAAYEQGTMKFLNFRGDTGNTAALTDNGRLTPLVNFETEEQYLARYSLLTGHAVLGYNLSATYAGIRVNRQFLTSAVVGDDVGTAVEGSYLVLVPSLFTRLGPLYAERAVFWKFAVGLGLGLARFEGTVQPDAGQPGAGPKAAVGSGGVVLTPAITAGWELQVERWLLVFRSLFLAGVADGDRFTYELYSLGLAYSFRF